MLMRHLRRLSTDLSPEWRIKMGKTLFDEIKGMSATELAEFLDAYDGRFVSSANKYICKRCKDSGKTCVSSKCDHINKWSDADDIREWLLQEANESEG